MAKAKKKESTLTLEERLAQALVPESEQPYKVPKNWCWTYLDKVSDVVTGKTPSKNCQEFYGGEFPFFKPADLDAGRNVFDASEYLSEEGRNISVLIPQNSTAVCCIGTIGKSGFLNRDGTTNQQINSAIPFFNPLYLYYFIKTDSFVNQLWDKASATTIAIVNKSKMEQCYFALAPLAEQQRIVERIESLFAKLDEAKDKLQEILDSYEVRKAAILHKAFSGELTAKWREENGVGLDSWEEKKLGEVTDVRDGTHESPQYYETGYPLITSKNLKYGQIINDGVKFISREDYEKINERSNVDVGDVLFAMIGTIGSPVVVENRPDFAIKNVALFKNIDKINPYYLRWYLESKYVVDKMIKEAKGTTQKFVPLGYLRNFEICLASRGEQDKILEIINVLMSKLEFIKKETGTSLARIEVLKKAILARAFRGELGTNDENDECAVELLKRVIMEQEPKITRTNSTMSKKFAVGKLTAMEKRVFNFIVSKEEQSANVGEMFKLSKDGFKIIEALRSLVEKNFLHMVSAEEYVIKE